VKWWTLVIAAGCAEPPAVDTNALQPSYLASDSGDGVVQVQAALVMNDNGFYRLGEDESLVAKVGDQMQTMRPGDDNRYSATVSADPEAETRFAIELYRASDLITSTMGFPGRFELGPVPPSFVRADTITLTWSPADSGMDHTSVIVDARPCIPAFVFGDGPHQSVTFTLSPNVTVACNVSVGFFRDRVITDPNPQFDDAGILEAVQSRVVSFVSLP
jgi:hypothetical protein